MAGRVFKVEQTFDLMANRWHEVHPASLEPQLVENGPWGFPLPAEEVVACFFRLKVMVP